MCATNHKLHFIVMEYLRLTRTKRLLTYLISYVLLSIVAFCDGDFFYPAVRNETVTEVVEEDSLRDVQCNFVSAGERILARQAIVAVVVEGAYQTLKSASDAIKAGIPLLVFAGSGKAADFIATAYDRREQVLVSSLSDIAALQPRSFSRLS